MSEPLERWVTAAALKALAAHSLGEDDTFLARELGRWVAPRLTLHQRRHATTRLCALGFVKHQVCVIEGKREDVYTITPEGAAAILAAATGYQHKSGPKGPTAARPLPPHTLAARLWALLRMRGMVESDTAAQTLCNAGEQDFARVRATVRRTLARWHKAAPDQLAVAARRVGAEGTSNGSKRYVLVSDSVAPPRWTAPRKAGKEGKA